MIPRHQYTKEEYERINKEFPDMLRWYYDNGRPEDYLKKTIWPIILECALSTTIKRYNKLFGKAYFNASKMEEWAIDTAMILITRITNEAKYPNGYMIKALPTTVSYALLAVSSIHKKEEEKQKLEDEYIEYITEKAASRDGYRQIQPEYNEEEQ